MADEVRIGVISDTHGLLREEAKSALAGSNLILHAGDVGGGDILEELGRISRVVAVRGNGDRGAWADGLPTTALVETDQIRIFLIHDIKQMEIDPAAAGVKLVISGHSHKPMEKEENGILYLNPGSAGRKRFKLPVGLLRVRVHSGRVRTEWVSLEQESPPDRQPPAANP